MRYSQFRIRNFKGVDDIHLDLDKPPRSPVFALVGLNESGKTTILEAIHWFDSPDRYDAYDLIPKGKLANFNDEISVEATVILSEEDQRELAKHLGWGTNKVHLEKPIDVIRITREFAYKNSEKVDEREEWDITLIGKTSRAKKNKQYGSGDTVWEKIREHIAENLLPPIIYYENFLFDFPEKIYLEAKEGHKLSRQDVIYRTLIQDVLNSIDRRQKIAVHILARHKSGGSNLRALQAVLLQLSTKISNDIFNTWRELLKIEETSGLEVTLGQHLGDDEKGYFIQINVKEAGNNFLIRERSLGFRWFFAFILFTHFRAYRYAKQRKALFLLDEPASNLHPSAQAKLLDLFERFPNQQDVIYTTHSHHMINPKWLSGTFVVKNQGIDYSDLDVNYQSHLTQITATRYFRFVAEYPDDTDYFKPILDSLDYQISKLEYAPEIIVTEGKNDFYTLKYLVDLGYVASKLSSNVFPGTGKDKVDYAVSLYLGWGRKFVVLLDDDKGGRQTYKRLLDSFGPILEDNIFRLNHIDKNWKGKTLEGLFSDSDYPKIMQHVYEDQTEYNKEKFNIALQDCYLNNRKVSLHTYTVNRFHKLFDFLEAKLAADIE